MPAFQASEQQNQFIPKASPSLKARLNYVSPSGLNKQNEIRKCVFYFF